MKARLEEAKLRDLSPQSTVQKSTEHPTPVATASQSVVLSKQSQPPGKTLKCTKCGGTNHSAKYCQWRGRAEPGEARGGAKPPQASQNNRVGALAPPEEQVNVMPCLPAPTVVRVRSKGCVHLNTQ